MCRQLTVSCLRRIAGVDICDHYLTFPDLKIPCKNPDSAECRAGTAKLIDFQNPPTLCAGRAEGLCLGAEERAKRCVAALEPYGRSLYRVNLEGTGKTSWWKRRGEQKTDNAGASKPPASGEDC